MLTAVTIFAVLVLVSCVPVLIGAYEPGRWNARGLGPFWFLALKERPGAEATSLTALAPSVTVRWQVRADFPFIGPHETYWTRFVLLAGGNTEEAPLTIPADVEDAYLVRLGIMRPPVIVLGLLRILVATGLLKKPDAQVSDDVSGAGFRAELMPDKAQIARLLASPKDYGPAMVNFLAYHPLAQYAEVKAGAAPVSGARAYQRYGVVAFQTVYRTGGHLVFYGAVDRVLRGAKAGPCSGTWHDIAVMQYRTPEAILSMEHVARYRAALPHRDAGLDRSVVIASS